jgi:hypothetical protein
MAAQNGHTAALAMLLESGGDADQVREETKPTLY